MHSPTFIICMITVGCCSNVIFLELLLNESNKAGSIVTLAQFIFISVEGLIQNFEIRRDKKTQKIESLLKKRTTPLYFHVLLVALFFTQTIINNLAFSYSISLPLHSIFRSGSLIMNMIVGIIGFGQT